MDMLSDPQYLARESIISVDHPVLGPVSMQNVFPKLSRTTGTVRWPGPALGQHTQEVLSELGISDSDLSALRTRGLA